GRPRQGHRPNAQRSDPSAREGRGCPRAPTGGLANSRAEAAAPPDPLAHVPMPGSAEAPLSGIFAGSFSPRANSCKYVIGLPTIRFSAFRTCSSYVERLTPRLRAMFSVVTSRGEV